MLYILTLCAGWLWRELGVGKDPIILHVFVTKDCVYSMDDEHYSYVHPRLFLRTFVLCKSVPG